MVWYYCSETCRNGAMVQSAIGLPGSNLRSGYLQTGKLNVGIFFCTKVKTWSHIRKDERGLKIFRNRMPRIFGSQVERRKLHEEFHTYYVHERLK